MPQVADKAIKARAAIVMARTSSGYYHTITDRDKYWQVAETAVITGVLKQCSHDPELAGVTESMIKTRLYECVAGWGGGSAWAQLGGAPPLAPCVSCP